MFTGLLIGIAFGILLQRTQFCFVSGFRRLLFQKNTRFITMLLIAVSIQSIGLFCLAELEIIKIPQTTLPIIYFPLVASRSTRISHLWIIFSW